MSRNSLKFGLFPEIQMTVGLNTINNVFPINRFQYIATTRSGIYKLDASGVKLSAPHKFCCSVYIEEYQLIAGISSVGGELSILKANDFKEPLISHYKTDMMAVFHLIYSPKSHAIISVGSGIRVYTLNCILPPRAFAGADPTVSITLRSKFADSYETSVLNAPCLDIDTEKIYLPTNRGFALFDLNGNQYNLVSKLSASSLTAAALSPYNSRLITAHTSNGLFVWEQCGNLSKRYSIGNSNILSIRFISKEFVLFVDSNMWVFILDLKTSKFFHCLTLDRKPNRLITVPGENPKFIMSDNNNLNIYHVSIPWKAYILNTTQPYVIQRCYKYNSAMRLLLFCKSNAFTFHSPKTRKMLTVATMTQSSGASSFFYDRSLIANYLPGSKGIEVLQTNLRHDLLFVPTEGGNVSVYTTGSNPCTEQLQIELQATTVTLCQMEDKWIYCFGTEHGELHFYDASTFKFIKRSLVKKDPIISIFYHHNTNSLIIIQKDTIMRFNLIDLRVSQQFRIANFTKAYFHGDLLCIACNNGFIQGYDIEDNKISEINDKSSIFHSDEVTGIAFDSNIVVSVSKDQYLKVWDNNLFSLGEIWFPFPLNACEIINGDRDIVVGTDNEVIIVKGSLLFDICDQEFPMIDNYNKLDDELSTEALILEKKAEKAKLETILNGKVEEKDVTFTRSNRFKRFNNMNRMSQITERRIEPRKSEMSEAEKRRIVNEMNKITEDGINYNNQVRAMKIPEPQPEEEQQEEKPEIKEEEETHEEITIDEYEETPKYDSEPETEPEHEEEPEAEVEEAHKEEEEAKYKPQKEAPKVEVAPEEEEEYEYEYDEEVQPTEQETPEKTGETPNNIVESSVEKVKGGKEGGRTSHRTRLRKKKVVKKTEEEKRHKIKKNENTTSTLSTISTISTKSNNSNTSTNSVSSLNSQGSSEYQIEDKQHKIHEPKSSKVETKTRVSNPRRKSNVQSSKSKNSSHSDSKKEKTSRKLSKKRSRQFSPQRNSSNLIPTSSDHISIHHSTDELPNLNSVKPTMETSQIAPKRTIERYAPDMNMNNATKSQVSISPTGKYFNRSTQLAYKRGERLLMKPRAPTPPPRHSYGRYFVQKVMPHRRRVRTPPMRPKKVFFEIPPPNILLDEAMVMKKIVQGENEYIPLLTRFYSNQDLVKKRLRTPTPLATMVPKETANQTVEETKSPMISVNHIETTKKQQKNEVETHEDAQAEEVKADPYFPHHLGSIKNLIPDKKPASKRQTTLFKFQEETKEEARPIPLLSFAQAKKECIQPQPMLKKTGKPTYLSARGKGSKPVLGSLMDSVVVHRLNVRKSHKNMKLVRIRSLDDHGMQSQIVIP